MDNKPQRKTNALSVSKLGIPAFNPANKGGPPAMLYVRLWQNNPRLILDTRDPNLGGPENNYARIEAPMTMADLFVLGTLLRRFAKSSEADKVQFLTLAHERNNGEKSKDITPKAAVWVGRDAEGHVFLSVIHEGNDRFPKIKIVLGPNDNRYSKLMRADGTPFTKADLSQLYAESWARMIETVTAVTSVVNYEPPMPPQGGYGRGAGGGAGGGYTRGGGGGYNRGGGGAPKEDVQEEEMPF